MVFENVRWMRACCTVQLGMHVLKCEGCDTERPVAHTRKPRFCLSCGKVAIDRWRGALLRLLPQSRNRHLVSTLPWQFRVLVRANRKACRIFSVRRALRPSARPVSAGADGPFGRG